MPPPVRRFSPAPGITVDVTLNSISISGRLECWGPEATAARAAQIQATLRRVWTRHFDDGFDVRCTVNVSYRPDSQTAADAVQIEIVAMAGPSNVSRSWGVGSRQMQLNANSADVYTWVVAHEFGHILGLADRYSEGIVSSVCGRFGCQRTNVVEHGYEGNLMGSHLGGMSSQNLSDLNEETAPSPWWIDDDDEVRTWVFSHSVEDVRALPTSQKIAAIQTLLGGWISDEDLNAIIRILQSVTDATEANRIRGAIDARTFSSLGQRTRYRLALAHMPGA